MELYSGYINKLIEQFAKLPGVGNKSAQRLALHVINMPSEHVERFAQIMVDAKKTSTTATSVIPLRTKRSVRFVRMRTGIIRQLW